MIFNQSLDTIIEKNSGHSAHHISGCSMLTLFKIISICFNFM